MATFPDPEAALNAVAAGMTAVERGVTADADDAVAESVKDFKKLATLALASAPGRGYPKSQHSIRSDRTSISLTGVAPFGIEGGRSWHNVFGRPLPIDSYSGLQGLWPRKVTLSGPNDGYVLGVAFTVLETTVTKDLQDALYKDIDSTLDRSGV